jgi:hypothetical protein
LSPVSFNGVCGFVISISLQYRFSDRLTKAKRALGLFYAKRVSRSRSSVVRHNGWGLGVMTAIVTVGAAGSSADLLTDLKSG